jgi:hypothetical protein
MLAETECQLKVFLYVKRCIACRRNGTRERCVNVLRVEMVHKFPAKLGMTNRFLISRLKMVGKVAGSDELRLLCAQVVGREIV